MNQQQFDSIENTLTQIRLQVYAGNTNEVTISNYLNNIEICRSFYPLLHFFEVSLRNAIDKALTDCSNGQEWMDILPLDSKSKLKIFNANQTIKLHRHYVLRYAFPNCPKYLRTAKNMQKRFENFRILRNRISHCERINHFKNLMILHTELLESIGWIEKEVADLASKMDSVQTSLNFRINL